jgi:hypothetical protein
MKVKHAGGGVALWALLTCLLTAGCSFPEAGREANAPERFLEAVAVYDP